MTDLHKLEQWQQQHLTGDVHIFNVANQLAICVLMLRPMVQPFCHTLLRAAVISFHLCNSCLSLF